MPGSIESLIYSEAQRLLELQPGLLNELRARTGILLAVLGASTAFLGAAVVDQHPLGRAGVLALICFAFAVGFCLWILSPHREWKFGASAASLLANYINAKQPDNGEDWTVEAVQIDLAQHMEISTDAIAAQMKYMQAYFIAAGILLVAEIGLWVIEFAT